MTVIKLGCAQMHVSFEDMQSNFNKAKDLIEKASRQNIGTLVFPEMFATGFSLNTTLAQGESDSIVMFLKDQAVKYDINIIAGYMSVGKNRPQNVAIAVNRHGRIIARYAKRRLFRPANEHNIMTPGDSEVLFELDGVMISLFICFDLRFPELYRKSARQSDLMITIAAWPLERQQHFETLLEARAIENQCYSVGVNQTGESGGIEYGGGSAIISPKGVTLIRKYGDEVLISAPVDTELVETVRREFPVEAFNDDNFSNTKVEINHAVTGKKPNCTSRGFKPF